MPSTRHQPCLFGEKFRRLTPAATPGHPAVMNGEFGASTMESATTRACLGFLAGAIAALVFHQGLSEIFDLLGIGRNAAFRLAATWPFGVPALVSLSFWGAMYGVVLSLALPRIRRPLWQLGLGLGLIAGLIALFVVCPLKGFSVAHAAPFGRSPAR